MVQENLAFVERQICDACARSGRKREEVTLIAVSKTKPVPLLREAYDTGIRDFGENKPQELRDKAPLLPPDIRWHMIGHLQRNKIKYVVGTAVMIHSVDSLSLAGAIDLEAAKRGVRIPVLAEVNMAGEESKDGLAPEEVLPFIEEASRLEHLQIRGLMTIAPLVHHAEENREIFRDLRKLSIDIQNKNIDNISMCELSMGMTNDYVVAIEEGATFVRVGTGIFGERSYPA